MAEYTVKITSQANFQLREIFNYISLSLDSPTAAMRLFDEIQKNILSLSNMPKRVALIDEEPWHSYGIHKMPVKNFLIYFWVDDLKLEVHITAIIYGKRNQFEQLKEMNI